RLRLPDGVVTPCTYIGSPSAAAVSVACQMRCRPDALVVVIVLSFEKPEWAWPPPHCVHSRHAPASTSEPRPSHPSQGCDRVADGAMVPRFRAAACHTGARDELVCTGEPGQIIGGVNAGTGVSSG